MKQEDLFEAIGNVESSRLLRTELETTAPSAVTHEEDKPMKKQSVKRIIRNLLIAAVLVSMLGITAYAAAGYLLFENPEEMLNSIFGDKTGYDHKDLTHWTDPEKPGEVYDNPAYDRVPVDEEVIQSEAAPLVTPVGQSISWEGYTLTVDANMYDKVTKCGVLTYTIENPDGLPHYEVANNGEIYFPDGEILHVNQYGYSYVIKDQTTENKLTATYYYQLRNPDASNLELTLSEYVMKNTEAYQQKLEAIREQLMREHTQEEALAFEKTYVSSDWEWFEANFTREELIQKGYEAMLLMSQERMALDAQCVCPDSITIPETALGEMSSITLADGKIKVSPIAICVDTTDMQDYPNGYIAVTKIRFKDGTEYLVRDDATANYMFAVGDTDRDVTFMFNRMIDVNEISSVILDGGLAFSVS
ncbi:MAG: hypothetical protein MSS60_04645 [Clostridiales bacterium]|nr:hypothetical protein [Clostridiales bacterium]